MPKSLKELSDDRDGLTAVNDRLEKSSIPCVAVGYLQNMRDKARLPDKVTLKSRLRSVCLIPNRPASQRMTIVA